MDILVIGNGFDLAHGLPTKYIDFLKWIEVMKELFVKRELSTMNWHDINDKIKRLLVEEIQNKELFKQQNDLEELMTDNFWIEYFLLRKDILEKNHKENWIDFESEISDIIQSFEDDITDFEENATDRLCNYFLNEKFIESAFDSQTYKTFREIRDILFVDLEKLIRLLEIYLCQYIEKIKIDVESPNINTLKMKFSSDENGKIRGVMLPRVLCFNYTHTFEKLYMSMADFPEYIHYIHGEASMSHTIESNNMVLGIDEYLKKKDRNKKIEFIGFKKYFQRIYKGTGCEYKNWMEKIKKDDLEYQLKTKRAEKKYRENFYEKNHVVFERDLNNIAKEKIKHHVYFFGHSLDVTDKDVIKDLILHETVDTTIFYYAEYENDKRDLYQKISNLVKIIGQKELIQRTGGQMKTIEFVPLKEMISIETSEI